MAISFGIIFVMLVLGIASFIRHFRLRKQHPPGPLGFPFVGELPLRIMRMIFSESLSPRSEKEYFIKMKEKYGDIWSIDIGGKRIVMLTSIPTMYEAFIENNKLFSGRSPHESFKIIGENRGIVFLDGKLAKDNRELAIKAMRDLGMGNRGLESKICYEADEFIKHIEKNSATPFESPTIFVKAIANVISHLTYDNRLDYDDPKLTHFMENLKFIGNSNKVHHLLEVSSIILPTKYTRKIFKVVDQYIQKNTECIEYIAEKSKSRMEIQAEFSKPSCVFDYFWWYRYQDQPEVDLKERLLNINHSIFDLFFAGIDTSTILLSFSCMILGQDLDLQEELRREIHSLVDDHNLINLEIKKDCPKLLSFIDEIQRHRVLISVVHRRVLKTCLFKGYRIEPTDVVYGNLVTGFHDPALFENPDDFNPYRFMDESRTKYIPNKSLIPFGIGKRACLGESVAMMELFLFLSKLIYRFNIILPEETETNFDKIFEGTAGIVHAPLDHKIIFEPINPSFK